jgi:hypothetical protein
MMPAPSAAPPQISTVFPAPEAEIRATVSLVQQPGEIAKRPPVFWPAMMAGRKRFR